MSDTGQSRVTRGRIFVTVVTVLLVASSFAIDRAPIWVPLVIVGAWALFVAVIYIKGRRRGERPFQM
jgi:hypothetical protein